MDNPIPVLLRLASSFPVLFGTGLVRPVRPDRFLGMGFALLEAGATPAGSYAVAAERWPDRIAVVDERDELTFRELDIRIHAAARGLYGRLSVRPGATAGLMARNSADFLVGQGALSRVGCDIVYLNTGFAAPQVADVIRQHGITVLIHDEEFSPVVRDAVELVAADGAGGSVATGANSTAGARPSPWREAAGSTAGRRVRRVVAWTEDSSPREQGTWRLSDLVQASEGRLPLPRGEQQQVILTSGTTGPPQGAPRSAPSLMGAVEPLIDLVGSIPLRSGQTVVVAAPAFHTWGFTHVLVAGLLGSTVVFSRRFDPAATLASVADRRADVLVVVPLILQRLLSLPDEAFADRYTANLRVIAVSGSLLPPAVAEKATERFGDVVYNLYGSTEVAYVSIAKPEDVREAPTSVGRPPSGATVRIVGPDDADVPVGEVGRVFAGNALTFAGYSGGGDKERLGGLAATGDLGRIGDDGRLYIVGRSDDMVITGGENVFPAEIEACLHTRPDVTDVVVAGTADDEWGQVLVAYVVLGKGARPTKATAESLRRHVREHLATYKVPKQVVFLDALPRNATGKVVKSQLPTVAAAAKAPARRSSSRSGAAGTGPSRTAGARAAGARSGTKRAAVPRPASARRPKATDQADGPADRDRPQQGGEGAPE